MASMATVMGKSKPEPVFRRSPGDKFTTIPRRGTSYPHATSAHRILTLASRTELSAIPTIVMPGMLPP